MKNKRFYIHTADDINKHLMDTESDFNIHIEEVGGNEELLIQLCNLLNKQQDTIEELKQGEEYERVTIHIDEDKKHEIENKYGTHYGFLPVMNFNDAEFDFKEHYLMIDSNSNKKIPYEIISKIEVVEK